MNKKIMALIILLIIFITCQIYKKHNAKPLIKNVEDISQISIYNFETYKSISTSDKSKIRDIATKWSKIIVRRKKVAWKNNDQYLQVITYNVNGETLETFFISKQGIIQYHWKLQIIEGDNPYYELSQKFYQQDID